MCASRHSHKASTTTGKLENKIALLTGGSRGIDLAMTRLFAAEGAQVSIHGRRPSALDPAAIEVATLATQVDSTRPGQLAALIARIKAERRRQGRYSRSIAAH